MLYFEYKLDSMLYLHKLNSLMDKLNITLSLIMDKDLMDMLLRNYDFLSTDNTRHYKIGNKLGHLNK